VVPGGIWAQNALPVNIKSDGPVAVASATQPVNAEVNKPHDDSFVIGANDVLAINVWKEPDVSRSVPVRSDGKISLPLAGEIQASGLTPLKLEQDIASKLQNYISEPEVTVIVQQINSQKFNILGMVSKPGSYSLTNSSTVLDAIAAAGGFRDFAKQKSIYVLRRNPNGTESRLPFNYKDVVKGKNPDQNVKLQPSDTIVVP
jgi:polysaccharide export outer membrane protein